MGPILFLYGIVTCGTTFLALTGGESRGSVIDLIVTLLVCTSFVWGVFTNPIAPAVEWGKLIWIAPALMSSFSLNRIGTLKANKVFH